MFWYLRRYAVRFVCCITQVRVFAPARLGTALGEKEGTSVCVSKKVEGRCILKTSTALEPVTRLGLKRSTSSKEVSSL